MIGWVTKPGDLHQLLFAKSEQWQREILLETAKPQTS